MSFLLFVLWGLRCLIRNRLMRKQTAKLIGPVITPPPITMIVYILARITVLSIALPIFASLKSHFGAGADRQKQDSFASSFKKSVDDSVQSREQAQELQDQKKDKAERDRKVREQREALAEARRESLEQAKL